MYNKNIYCHYTRRYIIKYLFLLYKKTYNKYLFLLYKMMYNDNKYFYYTRRRIMTINIFVIQEDV